MHGNLVKMLLKVILVFFLGEGQFGKVYTAVNINTGELMAMKEVTTTL